MHAWADERGVSIRPPFGVRTTTNTVTDDTRTTLRTPVMCLAVYAGDRLANVFPHSQGGDQYSVADAIAALETDDLELLPSTSVPSTRPPDRCPNCESLLTNVQGIGVCQNCDRIEFDAAPREKHRQRPSSVHRT